MTEPAPDSPITKGELAELHELIEWCRANESRIGYFAAVYTHVGGALNRALELGQFEHPEALRRLNQVFVDRYLTAFRAHRDAEPTTSAWHAAFVAAENPRLCLLQHVILGINAHINLDLAIVTAEAIPADELDAFHADFNLVNQIIASLVDRLSDELALTWPPLRWINRILRREDDVIIDFSTRVAREHAWQGALRLAQLSGPERSQAIDELDATATRLAADVTSPPWHLGIITFLIRLGERGGVVALIDDLLLMAALKPK
jgi:hypothetical protein